MKKFALVVILVALAVPNAFATCPTSPSGPYEAGGQHWYDWSPDSSCHTVNQMSSTTLSCYSYGAHSPNLSTPSYKRYSFTANDGFTNNNWEADAFVDFDDPNNSSSNWIDAWAYVSHNSVVTSYHLFYHDGTMGDLSCNRPWGEFSAADGDYVTVEITAYRANSNTTIKIGDLNIFNTQY